MLKVTTHIAITVSFLIFIFLYSYRIARGDTHLSSIPARQASLYRDSLDETYTVTPFEIKVAGSSASME